MIKVLIVDDEPFIRQGLNILIDWKSNGYEIAGEAANGKDALNKLKSLDVDLIITDIKMPEMNGLELIEEVYRKYSKKIKFIVLSGFYEFEYAKKAIKFGVKDYILKPIQKDELNNTLIELKSEFYETQNNLELNDVVEQISYYMNFNKLISGKYDDKILGEVSKKINMKDYLRFILVEISCEDNISSLKNDMFDILLNYMDGAKYNIIKDINDKKNNNDIGIIFDNKFLCKENINEQEYIGRLLLYLREKTNIKFYFYVGPKVFKLNDISKSYEYATSLKLLQNEENLLYYEEIYKDDETTNMKMIEKECMDKLINAIEENDNKEIGNSVDSFYKKIKEKYVDSKFIKINIDYLVFNLLNIKKDINNSEEDDSILYDLINKLNTENIISRDSRKNLKDFSLEFSKYLYELRQNSSKGILSYIDKEIYEHYMDKLSLKSLSEKYYLNSAYLGQIFKKKYNMSFKDYLNEYRIEKASELLKRSDYKIYKIAESVGYSNTDYFINKFMQIKGKTPYQYRKQFLDKEII